MSAPVTTDVVPTSGPTTLSSLTLARGLAAVAVVLSHIGLLISTHQVIFLLANPGTCAVPFFFLLSGFVLTWSYRGGAGRFWRRRGARLWPLYAVATLAAFPLDRLLGASQPALELPQHLLLVQAWSSRHWMGLDPPSWSLSVEAFFYLALPLLLRRTAGLAGRGLVGLVGGSVAIELSGLAYVYRDPSHPDQPAAQFLYHFPLFQLAAFLIGVCLAEAFRRGWRPPFDGRYALGAAALGWLLDTYLLAGAPLSRLLVAQVVTVPVAAVIVIGLTGRDLAEQGRGGARRPNRIGQRLGVWSFALYITHFPVLQVLARLRGRQLPSLGGDLLVLVLSLAVCLAVAGVSHALVEAPCERRLSGAAGSRVPAARAAS